MRAGCGKRKKEGGSRKEDIHMNKMGLKMIALPLLF